MSLIKPLSLITLAAGLVLFPSHAVAEVSPAMTTSSKQTVIPAKHQVWQKSEVFDADWLFLGNEAAPEAVAIPAAPEDQWEKITLPHTWNAKDTLETEKYRLGVSWYRKHFAVPAEFIGSGERRFIRFGAAGQKAQVFVNGQLAGEHKGGYSAFTLEIGPLLVAGDNVINVRVDNREDKVLPPTTDGLFNLYGGLYRSVTMLGAPGICLSRSVSGGPGVRVWSEKVSAKSAEVQVEFFVDDANPDDSLESHTVRVQLKDAAGKVVSEASGPARAKTQLALPAVSSPKLWAPEHPVLYELSVTLLRDGVAVDEASVRHGFRSFRFTPDKGFFLNEKPYKLRGVNRHQDFSGFGSALLPEHHALDIRNMKELGVNWLRLAHYQQDDYVLQLCDELGILVWEEIPFVRAGSLDPAFEANAQGMLEDMILQHFNHPSVLLWGLGNEIYLKKGADGRATYFNLISRLNDTIHRLDPVRKSVIVNGDANNATDQKVMSIPDVIGYNLYQGWYGGTVDKLTARMLELHQKNPDKPMILSEFGAGAQLGKFVAEPKIFDQSEDYQVYFLKEYLKQLDANTWLCGWNWWNYADFGWGKSSVPKLYNNKGLVTLDRKRKESFYVLRQHLTGVPAPKRVESATPVVPPTPASDDKVVNPFEVK